MDSNKVGGFKIILPNIKYPVKLSDGRWTQVILLPNAHNEMGVWTRAALNYPARSPPKTADHLQAGSGWHKGRKEKIQSSRAYTVTLLLVQLLKGLLERGWGIYPIWIQATTADGQGEDFASWTTLRHRLVPQMITDCVLSRLLFVPVTAQDKWSFWQCNLKETWFSHQERRSPPVEPRWERRSEQCC